MVKKRLEATGNIVIDYEILSPEEFLDIYSSDYSDLEITALEEEVIK